MIFDPHSLSALVIPVAQAAEEAQAGGPAATLGLNAKLFIGQLVNFSILLLVFWKWILPGITKGLQKRTERIEKSLSDADRIEKEKAEFEQWRQQELGKARQEASGIIATAQADAGKIKDATLHQTKEEQQKLIEQARKQIENDKQQAIQSAKTELADLITGAAEKVLRKKLDAKADQELIKDSLKSI
ncbi:MAG: F0F1 ATP synthase subunit B [Patescibacteria group bacterium]|nr:F0F1 ATP synthase subunit B [Patescibacteria group bacterium]